ncbi:nucleolar RNA helicase II [Trypanosoma cruzi]|uniref:Nucleolar RNA helicase II n=1 Tax=Trypanosoma cruzi TaxID=5693 RepID=A0A7J6XQ26_TRYCR|nr:nucleolar RNA helicase II [Trypanosoma cruzi]
METKQKQLRCSAHAARQDGSGACRAKESTNGPAWVCMQYIQWAHYVCASWGEVRARVHARGHTQRVSERTSVCAGGAWLSLPHSHAATTTAAAAAHATTTRSKRGEVVWETAVLPSLSPVDVIRCIAAASTDVSFLLPCLFSPRFAPSFTATLSVGLFFCNPISLPFSASILEASPTARGRACVDSELPSDSPFCSISTTETFSSYFNSLFGSTPSLTL